MTRNDDKMKMAAAKEIKGLEKCLWSKNIMWHYEVLLQSELQHIVLYVEYTQKVSSAHKVISICN
jgi:hypothetical protein